MLPRTRLEHASVSRKCRPAVEAVHIAENHYRIAPVYRECTA